MYINKLTITSIFEKNKNLLQAINPEKERAIGLIKDRLDTRNGFFLGDNIPKRLKNKVPKMFLDNQNKTQAQHSTKSFIG